MVVSQAVVRLLIEHTVSRGRVLWPSSCRALATTRFKVMILHQAHCVIICSVRLSELICVQFHDLAEPHGNANVYAEMSSGFTDGFTTARRDSQSPRGVLSRWPWARDQILDLCAWRLEAGAPDGVAGPGASHVTLFFLP